MNNARRLLKEMRKVYLFDIDDDGKLKASTKQRVALWNEVNRELDKDAHLLPRQFPSLHDAMDIARPDGAGQEIPVLVWRVYEALKKLAMQE